jgi:methionyl-tRNA formyltransferase
MRIAILTTESTASAEAAAMVVRDAPAEVVFVGISDPNRDRARTKRLVAGTRARLLPWLAVEYLAPRLLRRRGAGPVAAAARARGVAPQTILNVNGAMAQAMLAAARPELIVTCHFDQILAPETITIAQRGGINLHPSLLPRHRGPMPCFWAALDGDALVGATVHRLAPRIDAGAVLAQRRMEAAPGMTVSAMARALHLAGAQAMNETIAAIAEGRERGMALQPLPYRGFPDIAALVRAARLGVRLCNIEDWRAGRALGGVAL